MPLAPHSTRGVHRMLTLKLDTWQDREGKERTGLKVTAWRVETLGQIGRRKLQKPRQGSREAQDGGEDASRRDWQRPAGKPASDHPRGFDADIPF